MLRVSLPPVLLKFCALDNFLLSSEELQYEPELKPPMAARL